MSSGTTRDDINTWYYNGSSYNSGLKEYMFLCDVQVQDGSVKDAHTTVMSHFEVERKSKVRISDRNVTQKMDSGASRSMSGVPDRLHEPLPLPRVRIIGFNGTSSQPTTFGYNSDDKEEYYVPDMPSNLVLLCAHSYASDGAVILLEDGGMVIRLSPTELADFKSYIRHQYVTTKELDVKDRTYVVRDTPHDTADTIAELPCAAIEECFGQTATRYFNTKVHVSNQKERVLTLLLTGLSFRDWSILVKHDSISGVPPDVTTQMLNSFEHQYGCTPDIVRLAVPIQPDQQWGLMDPPVVLERVGQRYEVDCLTMDYNETPKKLQQDSPLPEPAAVVKPPKKLPSHGGATCAVLGVDCYSGYVHGRLLKSTANSVSYVGELIAQVEQEHNKVELLAADSGVLTASLFQVMTPDLEKYLQDHRPPITPERGEPDNHSVDSVMSNAKSE